ncbi:MAG: hypothetical protein MUC87_20830 [Bacteroidia bacterium]|jgi:hypothetical protein|nr:hypothetical protein [Bacteroidia bacterium]
MKPVKDFITFWINVISFVGSIFFVAHMMVSGNDKEQHEQENIQMLRKHIDSLIEQRTVTDTLNR